MVSGLLFTLSRRKKASQVAPSKPEAMDEGTRFPTLKVVNPTDQVVRAAKTAAVALALVGLGLYFTGTIGWSSGPNGFFLETPQVVADVLMGANS
jgi:hypothetical protein